MEEDMVPSSLNNKKTSPLGSQASELLRTEWTDEKHSLYLKSMEASFVHQLYNSYESLGWRSQEDCSSGPKFSRQMHASNRNSSGQFKVLRDGSWGTVNFRREESQFRESHGACGLSANPWIRHFRSGSRHQIVKEKPALADTSNQLPLSHSDLCHQDSVDSDPEMMGQNFVDEDVKSEKSSRMCSTKRMKTSVIATSSNDQGRITVTGKQRARMASAIKYLLHSSI